MMASHLYWEEVYVGGRNGLAKLHNMYISLVGDIILWSRHFPFWSVYLAELLIVCYQHAVQ